MRILTIFGTRPEAVKLAPVVRALAGRAGVEQAVCVTGQHREMLDQILSVFGIEPAYDLDLMRPGQTLADMAAAVLAGAARVIERFRPDWVVVQGDTTTALAGALAGFYAGVRVAHVEAGLRTGDRRSPWPEEMNRRLVSRLAARHLAPTPRAAAALRAEGVAEADLVMTGNSVVDALDWALATLEADAALRRRLDARFAFLGASKRLILVTGHRRENQGGGLERVGQALEALARRGDVDILHPVHRSPAVQAAAARLGRQPGLHQTGPLDYLAFIYLLDRAFLVITDSGGIQEEAPSLGTPVLVTRDTTERPEALEAGTARLVGTDGAALLAAATELLDQPQAYAAMAQAANPFGDGHAAKRIADALCCR